MAPPAPATVDWDLAVSTATRLVSSGPKIARDEADAVVRELRELAGAADEHVRELTRMQPVGPLPPTRIVDRPGWIAANTAGFAGLLTPLAERLIEKRTSQPGRVATAIGPRVTGTQTGLLLAFLAGKVLGQYEVFGPGGGELLLIAPNVVEVERALGVNPRDFRLWVCLHECTHRLQFTAVPWLADHMRAEVTALVDALDLDPKVLRERLGAVLHELLDALRGKGSGEGVLALVQGERARAVLDRITAFMSLVEGHAEYVMDAVGPDVVPSIAGIRSKFTDRRNGSVGLDRLLRRLLGLDAKMRQYADGGAFTRAVVDAVGMDGFNAVWRSAQTLPTRAELADPLGWVERVHGARPAVTA
ncbi:MAG: zinc-dependent metalloprotease [Mycobacteriales bacterium]